MALVVYDRVQQTGTANTTVSFTLSATTTGYQSFAVVGNGNTTYYSANDGTNWEVGIGTYSTTGPTLTRTTILSSSNSNNAVTFTGTVTVFCDYPAGKMVNADSIYTPSTFQGTFADGVVVDYSTGNARISAGTGDSITFYNGGVGNTQIGQLNSAGNLQINGGIYVNNKTISANYTIPSGSSGMSTGPITISSGITVTVSSGSKWVVL